MHCLITNMLKKGTKKIRFGINMIKVAVKRLRAGAYNCNDFFKLLYLCLHAGFKEHNQSED